jgi:hypothetical protein
MYRIEDGKKRKLLLCIIYKLQSRCFLKYQTGLNVANVNRRWTELEIHSE